jgi:nucleoid-associated protein YgaU
MGRHDNRIIFSNNTDSYKKYLEERKLKKISHFATPKFKYPSEEEMQNLELISHVWGYADKYYKLAHKYYGDSEYWWVIAWFNNAPMEGDLEYGSVIHIPTPLDRALSYFGV